MPAAVAGRPADRRHRGARPWRSGWTRSRSPRRPSSVAGSARATSTPPGAAPGGCWAGDWPPARSPASALLAVSPWLAWAFTTDADVRAAAVGALVVAALVQPVSGRRVRARRGADRRRRRPLPGLGGCRHAGRLRAVRAGRAGRPAPGSAGCGPRTARGSSPGRPTLLPRERSDAWLVTGAALPRQARVVTGRSQAATTSTVTRGGAPRRARARVTWWLPSDLIGCADLDAPAVDVGTTGGLDRGGDVGDRHGAEQPPGVAGTGRQPHGEALELASGSARRGRRRAPRGPRAPSSASRSAWRRPWSSGPRSRAA